jgi:hypothetical protein
MIETVANDALRWSSLGTADMPTVRSFVVSQSESGQTVSLTSESWDGRSRLEVTFLGVADLQVSWPDYPTPTQLDVIGIRDVSADGLENVSYRVAEDSGFFAFWCSEFFAVVIRGK